MRLHFYLTAIQTVHHLKCRFLLSSQQIETKLFPGTMSVELLGWTSLALDNPRSNCAGQSVRRTWWKKFWMKLCQGCPCQFHGRHRKTATSSHMSKGSSFNRQVIESEESPPYFNNKATGETTWDHPSPSRKKETNDGFLRRKDATRLTLRLHVHLEELSATWIGGPVDSITNLNRWPHDHPMILGVLFTSTGQYQLFSNSAPMLPSRAFSIDCLGVYMWIYKGVEQEMLQHYRLELLKVCPDDPRR